MPHCSMNVIAVPDAAMDGGQKIELAVDSSDTIGDVKQHIFRHLRWETNLRLIFAGKGLADGKTLRFYNIPDGSNLTYTSSAAVCAKLARRRFQGTIYDGARRRRRMQAQINNAK